MLSDEKFEFCESLKIPTFEVDGKKLLKRVTLIVKDGIIVAVHYPVFPSNSDPEWVISKLKEINANLWINVFFIIKLHIFELKKLNKINKKLKCFILFYPPFIV